MRTKLRPLPHAFRKPLRRLRQWQPIMQNREMQPRTRKDWILLWVQTILLRKISTYWWIRFLHYPQAAKGRFRKSRKSFFCVAVNLLDLSDIKEAIKQIQSNNQLPSLPLKEQSLYAAEVFQNIADRRNIKLKLTKKSSNTNPPQTAKHK